MRLHTNTLTYSDLLAAAKEARADLDAERHGSRSRDHSFDVHLTGESRRRPNRRGNHAPDEYAATWDQWGVFLAALFEADQTLTCRYYADGETFATRTGDRFGAPEDVMTADGYRREFKSYGWPEDAHGDHRFEWQGVPCEQSCTKCSAVTRWEV